MKPFRFLCSVLVLTGCVTTGTSSSGKKKAVKVSEQSSQIMLKFADDLAKQLRERSKMRPPEGTLAAHLCLSKGDPLPRADKFYQRLQQSISQKMSIKIKRVKEMPTDGWFLKCVTRFLKTTVGGQEMLAMRADLQLYAPTQEITASVGGEKRWRE